jgi:hypothetical protein
MRPAETARWAFTSWWSPASFGDLRSLDWGGPVAAVIHGVA